MTQQDPEPRSASELEAEISETEDIETLRQELAEAKAKAETNLAGWQRAQADFINYKRRSEQEKEETVRFANSLLLSDLLPILDDMERAFASIPPRLAKNDWVNGIRLIERKLKATLEAQGLSHIEALGQPFDPRLHEAVRQSDGEEGIVVQELQKGYQFRDRVIRPSKVAVGNGNPEPAQPDQPG